MLTVPGYEVGEAIHEGTTCCVYRARRSDGVEVILKALRAERPKPAEIAWFRREYGIHRELDLPGVVKAYGLENHGWLWALVLEDFGGRSLDRLMPTRPWSLAERLRVAAAAVAALGQLHAKNIIHKDISPAHVVWNPATGVLKLVDLSISTELSREAPAARSPGDLEGTLPYLSPEQTGRVNRALDHRSDFYSLGATLYELFTGVTPFSSADPMELVHCHIARRPVEPCERNPAIPKTVSDIVMRLLAKTPEARYQSSYGLQADLEQCIARLSATGAVEPFLLGQQDVVERFHIPQALYGRDRELGALLSAFEQIGSAGELGRAALALVTGYSGVGKSTLVREMYKPITARRGYLVAGKFEQLQRMTPYSALVAAFSSLLRQLLSESEAALAAWRRQLLDAVGMNGRVVIDLIPELELILGPQPPLAELDPQESQNRFNLVFGRFIRVFARPSHPLAIFLDDLQWADSASLKLIERFFADDEPQCLFVIGAYRDHEVGPGHPLLMTLDALREAPVAIHRIPLAPLGLTDVTQLVADAVVRPAAEVVELGRVVGQKTDGNPLFVTELLKALYEDGLLDFDRTHGRWRWDAAGIVARGIADNVVDLVLGKLRRLPEATQRAAQLAACVGGSFDLGTLAIILEMPTAEAFRLLLPAIQEGFVAATSGLVVADADDPGSPFVVRDLKFTHDRVQQAAYHLSGEEERTGMHLRIGRLLLGSGAGDRGDGVFQVVDQLNRGQRLIEDAAERRELSRLDLEAALRARRALAYGAAKSYLESGVACLSEASWDDAYDLAFGLHKELCEIEYVNSEHEASEALCKRMLERARTPSDKVELYLTLVNQYTLRARYNDAFAAAKDGLALLGVDLPLGVATDDLSAAVEAELGDLRAQLDTRPIASLLDEPEMTDPAAQMISSLLRAIVPPAFFTSQVLFSFVVFKAIGISLRFGPSRRSADLFSHYGVLLCGVPGEYAAGYEFGKLAVALTERFGLTNGNCMSAHNLANYIAPWVRPMREIEALIEAAFRAAIEAGDMMVAGYAFGGRASIMFYAGRPLDEVAAAMQSSLHLSRKTRNQVTIADTLALLLVVENLRGRTASSAEFCAEDLDETAFLATYEANQGRTSVYLIAKAEALYLYDDPRGALAACAMAEPLLWTLMGHVTCAHHALYQALSLAARYDSVSAEEQTEAREKLGALGARWERWAASCPENLAHLHALVSAEIARLDGDAQRAIELYDQAIEGAQRGGFIQHGALAAELSAKFWLARGRTRVAAGYLGEALSAYRLRGAARKVELLERRYPALLGSREEARPALPDAEPTTAQPSESPRAGSLLDINSVLKVSQTITSEIVLDRLLTKLMLILIENAGARKGAIVFEKSGELVVEVDAGVDEGSPQGAIASVLRSTPIQRYPEAAEEIIRYVARTRETVILSDAVHEGGFTRNTYVVERAPKSIVCGPILSQGRMLAIIYLENNLTTGTFTPERLEVLRMLASQIATSLENALLYREIEERVVLRTTELQQRTAELQQSNVELSQAMLHLRKTQDQLVQSEKMASMGRLTMGVAHEIKNPLNFVNNFAKLDVELVDELEQAMAKAPGTTLAEVRDTLALLKETSTRVRDHGMRADDIVQGMLRHAGGGTGVRRAADLNALLDDVVRLVLRGDRVQQSGAKIRVEHDYDAAVGEVTVAPQEMSRLFVNLLDNAVDAVLTKRRSGHGAYTPTLRVSTRREGGSVVLRVHDNGAGILRDIRDRIFEPFFTTKPPGMGTGLGLSLSYDIVQGHGGTITCESVEGEGTTFFVALPA